MNMLVDGEWGTDAYESTNEDGEFDRQESSFRNWLDGSVAAAGEAPKESHFAPEPGRYHLYICRACPWAHRAAMVRQLRGLEDEISISLTHPERYDQGWEFSDAHPDPLSGHEYLREVYTDADPEFTGRVTVPVLWDKEEETIVNNESSEIMRMLDTAFDGNELSLYPETLRAEIDEIVEAIYEPINNGVYRAGFAGTQEAYDAAVDELFDALDHWDGVLADQRYLAGDGEQLTLADVAMFATLVRFDHVYHTTPTTVAKDSGGIEEPRFDQWKRIQDYDNLLNYTRDIYQTDGVGETVNLDHIVRHYASPGSPNLLTHDVGDVNLHLGKEHGRDRLS